MNILGYSGLHGAINFRKSFYSDFTEQEYRMCQGLDSAACIMVDNHLIAAVEEERFNGEKYTCNFPINAVNYCLQKAGLTLSDLDYICHGFNYQPYHSLFLTTQDSRIYYQQVLDNHLQIDLWRSHFPDPFISDKFVSVDHHLAHAATAYYPSQFDSALVLIADGIGEMHSLSLFSAENGKINLLKNYNLFSSLGVLYSQITAHLGFYINSDEYKVMGLAPYGDKKRYQQLFNEIIEYRDQGHIFIKKFKLNTTETDRQTGRGFRKWLSENCFSPRTPESAITQEHKDLAAALQNTLEEALLHILSFWQKKTSLEKLCMAGGVALNCTANGNLLRKALFKDIYIQPAANDAGTAIGAAMIQAHQKGKGIFCISPFDLPYFGPDFHEDDYKKAIEKFTGQITYKEFSLSDVIKEAAKWITNRKIIAWVQDRMEFGPRALGNRSILADPTDPSMRDRINLLIKQRESFRPFAPSVKFETAHHYFDIPREREFPHMLYTVPVKDEYKSILPAITHVDGTARIQTVNRRYAEKYWLLLDAVEQLSGIPLVLNTSFNMRGQPIVCTPEEAIRTLISAKLDALFMGNFLITVN